MNDLDDRAMANAIALTQPDVDVDDKYDFPSFDFSVVEGDPYVFNWSDDDITFVPTRSEIASDLIEIHNAIHARRTAYQ